MPGVCAEFELEIIMRLWLWSYITWWFCITWWFWYVMQIVIWHGDCDMTWRLWYDMEIVIWHGDGDMTWRLCDNMKWKSKQERANMVQNQGIARTQSPTNKNCAPESPTFGAIARVSPSEVQWKGLALGEPPNGSRYLLCQVSMLDHGSNFHISTAQGNISCAGYIVFGRDIYWRSWS